MEYQKYIRMQRITRWATAKEEIYHLESWIPSIIFFLIVVIGYFGAAPLTNSTSVKSLLNSSGKITYLMNSSQLISIFSRNSTAFATYSVAFVSANISLMRGLVFLIFLMFGYAVMLFLGSIPSSSNLKLALKESRRQALLKAGYTEKDMSEYRKEYAQIQEVI